MTTKSGSRRAATAARTLAAIASALTSRLPDRWPQRLGSSWSSRWMPAAPAASNRRTARSTFSASPKPVSASHSSGREVAALIPRAASVNSVSVNSPTTITATTPAGSGTVDVIVTVEGQSSAPNASDRFTYTTGPTITNVQATVNPHSATITWTTDIPADSQVAYGTTIPYSSKSALNTSLVTSHSVTLSFLARYTKYHYQVYSKDSAGNLTVSGDFTFTTR